MKYRNRRTFEIVEMAQIVDVSQIPFDDELYMMTLSDFHTMSQAMRDMYDIDIFTPAFDDFTPDKKCMSWITEFASKFNCEIEMDIHNCLVYSDTAKERSITSMTEKSFNEQYEQYDMVQRYTHINLDALIYEQMAHC